MTMTMERRRSIGRRESDASLTEVREDAKVARTVLNEATNEIVALREERDKAHGHIARLQKAGDELASMLNRAPGIDPMRSSVLAQWRDAKTNA